MHALSPDISLATATRVSDALEKSNDIKEKYVRLLDIKPVEPSIGQQAWDKKIHPVLSTFR